MAIAGAGNRGPLAEINVTPLVDVMLVLLIIFMVTAPLASYPLAMDLPQRSRTLPPPVEPPPPIELRMDAANQLFWDGQPIPADTLQARMEQIVQRDPANQPTLQIDANPDADYQLLAQVLAAAKNAQVEKIGFVRGQ